MGERPNKRLEQEIGEILDRNDLGSPSESVPNKRNRPSRPKLNIGEGRSLFNRVPPGILWLIGIFGFAILAFLVADWSRNLALLFGILSILVVFSPLYFWRRPKPMGSAQKEWRGRVIQMPPREDEGLVGKLRYKIWEFRNRSR